MRQLKEAKFYRKRLNKKVECYLCARRCVIPEGKTGFCFVRKNIDGVLFTLTYARLTPINISPIERKPMYHFYPDSKWLSVGSLGCNFRCKGCQNYEIACITKIEENLFKTEYIEPQDLVNLAKTYKTKGISFTYNEPTIQIEYILEVSKLAKSQGLLTNWVTNASINPEVLKEIIDFIDSYRADIKGFSKNTYEKVANFTEFNEILKNVEFAFKKGVWVEIVTNIIPTLNDDLEELKNLALWIKNNLSENVPWHITRFFPYFKLKNLYPTPIKTLQKIREMALEIGLKYVYIGNVNLKEANNTYCPKCKSLLVERDQVSVIKNFLSKGECPVCGYEIPGRY